MFKGYNRRTKRCLVCEEYISLTKDLRAALLLNQCVYWMERTQDYDLFLTEEYENNSNCNVPYRHGWFYKSYEAFNDECMLGTSKSTIARMLTSFVEHGWLERRHRKTFTFDQTYEYRVNLTKLQSDLLSLGYIIDNYKIDLILLKSGKQEEIPPKLRSKVSNEHSDLSVYEQDPDHKTIEALKLQESTCLLQGEEPLKKPLLWKYKDFTHQASKFHNETSISHGETCMLQEQTPVSQMEMPSLSLKPAENSNSHHETSMLQDETSMFPPETCKLQGETSYIDTKITNTEITNKTLSLISLPKPSNSISDDRSKKERDEIGLKMIKIFSRIVFQGQELLPHPERINHLKHVLHSQLQGKIENWEKVCQNITRSKFLMGEAQTSDFKATLDWVMMKDHAIKIFEGNSYGIGDRNASHTPTEPTMEEREALLLEFKNSNKHPLWLQAGQLLFKKVEFSIFKNFISALDIHQIHQDCIDLLAPHHYIQSYMSKNLFSIPIKQALETALGRELRFVYVSVGSKLDVTSESKNKTIQKEPLLQSVYPDDLVPQAYFPPLGNPHFKGTRVAETQEFSPDPPTILTDNPISDNEHY
jgi:hypothetical protein